MLCEHLLPDRRLALSLSGKASVAAPMATASAESSLYGIYFSIGLLAGFYRLILPSLCDCLRRPCESVWTR